MSIIKKRSKLVSILITIGSALIMAPGLGQIFAGRLRRGLLVAVVFSTLGYIYAFGGMNSRISAIVVCLALIVWNYFFLIEPYILNSKKDGITLKKYNKWYFYIIFAFILKANFIVILSMLENYQGINIMSDTFKPQLQAGDIVVAKMNYGYTDVGVPHQVVKRNSSSKRKIAFVLVEETNFNKNAYVVFHDQQFADKTEFVGKILAFSGEEYKKDSRTLTVPEDNMLLDSKFGEVIVSRSNIDGKILYVFNSRKRSVDKYSRSGFMKVF